jgi:hypothetical protein
MLVAEATGGGHSFSVALSAHTGIGTLPIVYYGNSAQKAKYLPKLATGEWKAAYCLTEPDSGSDANSGKTKAVLSEDGNYYVLNGQKMWITNGGFADVYIVFAKVDESGQTDKNLSAFIVERSYDGITRTSPDTKWAMQRLGHPSGFSMTPGAGREHAVGAGHGFKVPSTSLISAGSSRCGNHRGAKEVINAPFVTPTSVSSSKPIAQFGASSTTGRDGVESVRSETARTERAKHRRLNRRPERTGMGDSEAKLKALEQLALSVRL